MAQGFFGSDIQYYGAGEENLKRAVTKNTDSSDTFNNCAGIERSDRSTGTAVLHTRRMLSDWDLMYIRMVFANSNHCSV